MYSDEERLHVAADVQSLVSAHGQAMNRAMPCRVSPIKRHVDRFPVSAARIRAKQPITESCVQAFAVGSACSDRIEAVIPGAVYVQIWGWPWESRPSSREGAHATICLDAW